MIDFKEYKNAARYARAINEGCHAELAGYPDTVNPYPPGIEREAWHYGYRTSDRVLRR